MSKPKTVDLWAYTVTGAVLNERQLVKDNTVSLPITWQRLKANNIIEYWGIEGKNPKPFEKIQ